MTTQRWLLGLTLVNAALLVATLVERRADSGQPSGVLRGSAFEIVDSQGRVRASLGVLPAGRSAAGAAYPETVLLRLITERGRPAVKISTSEEGSGVSLAGPTGTQDAYVTMTVQGSESSLTLRNEDGRQRVVSP